MKPRYTVGSVTGVTINQGSRGGGRNSRLMPVIWYVYDSAYCYRQMHECWSEAEARALAARANGLHP